MDSRFADNVRNFALGETAAPPWGKVNDYSNDPESRNYRFGWRRLKEYFEVAAGYNEGHWRIPGYLDGIKLKGKRIPTNDGGIQWCGIFATYCWIRAGVPGVRWNNPGVVGPSVKKVAGYKGIGVGDIAVLSGGLVHHCIVSAFHGPANQHNTRIETVNGNSDWQSVRVKTNKLSEINAYYTLDSELFQTLRKMYGN